MTIVKDISFDRCIFGLSWAMSTYIVVWIGPLTLTILSGKCEEEWLKQ